MRNILYCFLTLGTRNTTGFNFSLIFYKLQGRPYLEYAKGEGLTGNARYEGYSMDIIEAIAKDLGFKFRMELVPDKEYGSLNKVTKQWNGLIRELREQVLYFLLITF